jgi:hypothetical protein
MDVSLDNRDRSKPEQGLPPNYKNYAQNLGDSTYLWNHHSTKGKRRKGEWDKEPVYLKLEFRRPDIFGKIKS